MKYRRTRPPCYSTWMRLRQLCGIVRGRPERAAKYYDGITLCDEWLEFGPFQRWALSHGLRDGLVVARVDKTKDFSPDNCRVVTKAKAGDMRSVVRKSDDGSTIREVVGDGAPKRYHDRVSYRYFTSGWDLKSATAFGTLSANDAGGISARAINERTESDMNKIVSAAVAAVMAATAAAADTAETPVTVDQLDKIVQGVGPEAYVAGGCVTNVRASAFFGCSGLRSVEANEVKTVGRQAFAMCPDLVSVRLDSLDDPKQLSTAFSGCKSLVNVYLPSIDFTSQAKMGGFPWQAPNLGIVFHFRNGDYDRLGRRID